MKESSVYAAAVIVLVIAIAIVYGRERLRAQCDVDPSGVGCFLMDDHE